MNDVKLLPLPDDLHHHHIRMGTSEHHAATRAYASVNLAAMQAEVERLREDRDSFQRVGIAAHERAERLAEALREVLPFAEHADCCGDSDAYNHAAVPTCGCGLDGAREHADAALQEAGNAHVRILAEPGEVGS